MDHHNNYYLLENRMNDRNNNFDFLRFIAATAVILSHSYPLSGNNNEFFGLLTNGQSALGGVSVAIFFIISGFLITMSFDKNKSVVQFVINRVLRIFPALLLIILLSVFIIGPIVTTLSFNDYFKDSKTYDYLKTFFLFPVYFELPGVFGNNPNPISVNGSLWTLSYEILSYFMVVIFGLLGFYKKKFRGVILFLFLLLVYLNIFRANIFDNYNFRGVSFSTFSYLFGYFVAGMLVYCYKDKITINRTLFICFSLLTLISMKYGGFKELFPILGSYLVICIAYSKKIKLYNFSKFGDLSYGLYIFAFPIQQLVTWCYGGKMNVFLHFFISFLICVVLSYASWHLIEKQFLKLKTGNFKKKAVPNVEKVSS